MKATFLILFLYLFIVLNLQAQTNYYDGSITVNNFKNNALFKEKIKPERIDYERINACVFFATNEQRVKNGLEVVGYYQPLEVAAWFHSKHMMDLNFFSHGNEIEAGRKSPSDRMRIAGVKNPYGAENIAAMYSGGRTYLNVGLALVEMWMNSKGHKANILSKENKKIGCGVYIRPTDFKTYGTQVFQWFYEPELDESAVIDKFEDLRNAKNYTYKTLQRYQIGDVGGYLVEMNIAEKILWQKLDKENKPVGSYTEESKDANYIYLGKEGKGGTERLPIKGGWYAIKNENNQWIKQNIVFKVANEIRDIQVKKEVLELYKKDNGSFIRNLLLEGVSIWQEGKSSGEISFSFSEESRDDEYAVIHKLGTNMYLKIPLKGGMVYFGYEAPTIKWGGLFSVVKEDTGAGTNNLNNNNSNNNSSAVSNSNKDLLGNIGAALQLEGGKFNLFMNELFITHDISGHQNSSAEKVSFSELNNVTIDAAVNWGNGKFYLFTGSNYFRGDFSTGTIDEGYPKPITNNTWPGLPWTNGIDAAVNYGNGKAYFFKGDEYCRYDIQGDSVDEGYPKKINVNWRGVNYDRIDAAVNLGNGNVYFFRKGKYLTFNIQSDQAVNTPSVFELD